MENKKEEKNVKAGIKRKETALAWFAIKIWIEGKLRETGILLFPSGCISWISCCVFSRLQKRVGEEEREDGRQEKTQATGQNYISKDWEEASNISRQKENKVQEKERLVLSSEGFLWSFDSFDCSFDSWSWRWSLSSCVSRLAFFLFSFLLSVFFPLLLLPSSIFFDMASLQSGDQSYLSSLPMSSLHAGLFYPEEEVVAATSCLPFQNRESCAGNFNFQIFLVQKERKKKTRKKVSSIPWLTDIQML